MISPFFDCLSHARAHLGARELGLASATFEIFGNFCDFRQLLKFLATFDFFAIFKLFFFATFITFGKESQLNSTGLY